MNSFSEKMLSKNEKIEMSLRWLYEDHGFKKFKMNRFEEYDLYRENKSFLTGSDIITFNDLNGKLMALKPDVTLSIVKNVKEDTEALKLYYSENVYRAEKGAYEFKEIVQAGVEHIGKLDLYSMCEILMLAAVSLEKISENYILDISHIGILAEILEDLSLKETDYDMAVKYIGEKNVHDLKKIFDSAGVDERIYETVAEITKLYGPIETVLSKLENILSGRTSKAFEELKEIYNVLYASDMTERINLDFSLINDMNYYNGIIFQGFISGIPKSVLSGGRYDKLLEKLGKNKEAAGFAVYLNLIEEYCADEKAYDFDNLIVYSEKSDLNKVFALQKKLIEKGETVRVQNENSGELRFKNVIDFDLCGGEI